GKEGTSAYDSVTDTIWGAYQYADSQGVWSINPNTGVAVAHSISLTGTGIGQYGQGAIAVSKRAWVILGGNNAGAGLYVLNLDNPTAGPNEGGWYHPSITNPGSGPNLSANAGPGFVWHAASGAFLCWHGNGSSILKLKMNGDPFTGTYTWSTITPASGNSVAPGSPDLNGTWGRFNIISDMGNGQSALVLVNDVSGPV